MSPSSSSSSAAGYFAESTHLWAPIQPRATSIDRFRLFVNQKHGLNLKDFHDLHKYSIERYEFWADLWDFLGIISSVSYDDKARRRPIVILALTIRKIIIPGKLPTVPIWFPNARLNYAENLLNRRDDSVAVIAGSEPRRLPSGAFKFPRVEYTYKQLHALVRQMASALRAHGVVEGDRVACVLNHTIHPIIVALAATSIGAIFSVTGADMGVNAILDRYKQIRPKVLFIETEVVYNGVTNSLVSKAAEVLRTLKDYGLEVGVVMPSLATGKTIKVENSISLADFLAKDTGSALIFAQLPFSHPVFIMFSSGTSELRLHFDLRSDDVCFQYTSPSWMVWNVMLMNIGNGAKHVLYDGSPFYPDMRALLRFADETGTTLFGTSPRFLSELRGQGIDPYSIGAFQALRTISSTGAVLTPIMFEWTQKAFGAHVYILSCCGGTDIMSAFVTGSPTVDVYAGETSVKSLGMDVRVFDDDGKDISETGMPGEMVCARPHPSLPLYLWGDNEKGDKYTKTYYDMYPGIWRQGDLIVMNPATRGYKILGRSDGVLNPSGVRFGAAELYSVLEPLFATLIADAIAVSQRRPGIDEDERVILFVKMRTAGGLTDAAVKEMKDIVRRGLSARHVPEYIVEVEDIPYTATGKRIEIAVKDIVSGSNKQPSGTAVNPESLQLYYKYRELPPVKRGGIKGKARSKL
ncbi:Acetoacetyl-CoA synthetase [Mycena kentingensis (nom. inval.)]|nr:Acetoacetyl-CoA synthetase [Mycena kentingensis (nom. inval.)]